MMEPDRVAGALLLAGSTLFIFAASLATGRPRVFGASPFEPPVMIHMVPAILAVLLIVHGSTR